MSTLSDVAQLLKTARKQARLSQAEIAARAGVARTTVARMENLSKGDMSVSALVRLLEAAGCDLKAVPICHRRTVEDKDSVQHPEVQITPASASRRGGAKNALP